MFQWKRFFCCLLNNRFSLFFELLDNQATHITWLSEEDLAELYQPHLSGSFKHSVGMEGFDKANVVVTNTVPNYLAVYRIHTLVDKKSIAQSARAVEYTDCTSAEG